jgi:hypothetical protein
MSGFANWMTASIAQNEPHQTYKPTSSYESKEGYLPASMAQYKLRASPGATLSHPHCLRMLTKKVCQSH